MTKDEALTLARDWIAERPADRSVSAGKMISIIDRALAQPEQYTDIVSDGGLDPRNKFDAQPKREWVELTIDEFLSVFAENDAPEVSDRRNSRSAQRPWVGLAEHERVAIAEACGAMSADWLVFVEAVEKALKEKNT